MRPPPQRCRHQLRLHGCSWPAIQRRSLWSDLVSFWAGVGVLPSHASPCGGSEHFASLLVQLLVTALDLDTLAGDTMCRFRCLPMPQPCFDGAYHGC